MKRVSEIGVLFEVSPIVLCFGPLPWLIISGGMVDFRYKVRLPALFSSIPISLSPILIITMSSPSSSYVQVGLDNLERPLNRSPSPRAQVRGFDWSSILVG